LGYLSRNSELKLDKAGLQELLESGNYKEFASRLIIYLPGIKKAGEAAEEFNRNLVRVIQFA